MIVNYQYHSMEFVAAGCDGELEDAIVMDDSDLDCCFRALTTGGRNVRVVMQGGGQRLLRYIKEHYIYVKAAGGLVHDAGGRLLLMVRNERADLPKGKVEPGETLAAAALRETEEETGLNRLRLGRLWLKTYHIYDLYGGWHFKQTSWFEMWQTESQMLVPQKEEGITSVEWVSSTEWRRRLEGSYATMRVITRKGEALG